MMSFLASTAISRKAHSTTWNRYTTIKMSPSCMGTYSECYWWKKKKTFQRTSIVNTWICNIKRTVGMLVVNLHQTLLTDKVKCLELEKTFRVSSMSKLFSSLTIQEGMGTLTGKRTFVEWWKLCNHSIILVRKKGFENFTPINGVRFPKKFKERLMRHLKKRTSLLELNEDF